MKQLVYDIGMANGDDTAYYLHRGYRVVAIEAQPGAVERAQERFPAALAAGDLIVLNVAIAAERGEATFWLCESLPDWSSFDREIASRMGAVHRPVVVPCVRFDDLVREHGPAQFAKVDIEGSDRLCVNALTPETAPQQISIEMCHRTGILDIGTLYRLGYRRFRCVRQNDFWSIEPGPIGRQAWACRVGFPARLARRLFCRVRERRPSSDGYIFPFGSSGPFGDDLPGRWLDLIEICRVWSDLAELYPRFPLWRWYDIHAALDSVPGVAGRRVA